MGIINVKLIALQALATFLWGVRFVFGSLHFIANQLGDLSMKELEQQENLGSSTDRSRPTSFRVSHVSDLLEENAGHLRSCHPSTTDPICSVSAFSKSDSDGDRKVFMVGQGDTPPTKQKRELPKLPPCKLQGQRGR
jgi:hypothetical protein